MYIDLLGKKRQKVNLHTHTSRSDGRRTPEEVIALYRENGYDAIALTDHWVRGDGYDDNGMTILGGAEYNIGSHDSASGVYHILGLGVVRDIEADKSSAPQTVIDAVHAAGGLAVLAHPAWSLNTPEQILALRDVDATEIYNSVSGVHFSRRPDSSLIVDMIATRGLYLPLVADDDAHYYDTDACVSWIMAEAEDNSEKAIFDAVKAGKFYATQGPEVHMWLEGDEAVVKCSPAQEIVLFSNLVWSKRVFEGEGLTEARYKLTDRESFLRCEVTDRDGKRAWTNIIPIQ
jgi:hypothetical protein